MNSAVDEDCQTIGKFLLRRRIVEEASSSFVSMWVEASSALASQDTHSIGSPRTRLKGLPMRLDVSWVRMPRSADLVREMVQS